MVKSHLMFAVREEVEVLKEQIRDLAERNAALEQENGLLRALASPEQLSSALHRAAAPCSAQWASSCRQRVRLVPTGGPWAQKTPAG